VAKSGSYMKAAFLMPANLFALAAAGVASALVGDPIPIMVALGAEGLYLGLLSSAPAFRRAVKANLSAHDLEEAGGKEAEALLEDLAASQREHYFLLRDLRDKILANYRKLPGGRVVVASSEARVDALLTAFLRLISTLNGYRKYLNTSDRKALEGELSDLEKDTAAEQNPRLKEVKGKRVEILQKRVQRFVQAEESREVVSHQLAGIEDLLRLTHEQSIAIRDPESIGRQLEALTAEVQETEETVREMEKFMEFTEELGSAGGPRIPHGTKVR
jgi:hypothetical protein